MPFEGIAGVLKLSAAVGLAAIALGAGGCGSTSATEEDAVRAAVGDLQEAFADGDLKEICGMLSKGARWHVSWIGHNLIGTFPKPPCTKGLGIFHDGLKESADDWRDRTSRDVTDVRIKGRTATATVEFGEGASGEVPLVRERGEWRVNGLFGGIPGRRQLDHF